MSNILYYGGHISIEKGIINALQQIQNMNGNFIQIFLSNPMTAKFNKNNKKYSETSLVEIYDYMLKTNTKLVIHLPYVINLANPSFTDKYFQLICDQLDISNLIGSIGCVVHVGKHLEQTYEDGINNMKKSLKQIINYMKSKNMKTHIILETGSCQGTELLSSYDNSLTEFAEFYNSFSTDEKKYFGICVDTCHIFAGGYDISKINIIDQFFTEFDTMIGFSHLDVIHLNDSKNKYNSHVDRHENLGDGYIGIEGISYFIQHALTNKIPLILETPSKYESEIQIIKKLIKIK